MEYMVSGTPLVTTSLPGMPEEYKDYVYIFTEENVYGIYSTLKLILSKKERSYILLDMKQKNSYSKIRITLFKPKSY